jgi:hypothetical protein
LIRAAERRRLGKDRAAEDALAGRLTLLEAAAAWRDLDAELQPGPRVSWRLQADGDTDEERYCRQMLARAARLAEGRPGAEASVAALRRQLEEALAGGDPRLPGSAPRPPH